MELNINEPGLLYGATIFTTLRVYEKSLNHPLTNWKAHCDRLKFSLQKFGWSLPDWEVLRQGAELIIKRDPTLRILRITIFPDGREWITVRLLPTDLSHRQHHGVDVYVASTELSRSLPTHKTGNYLSPWLAKNAAQKFAAQEAILVNTEGNWLETSTGNLWGWGNNSWWTPPLDAGILPGVMRNQLINWLKQNHYQVYEFPWTNQLVQDLEAIAYSNSVVEIVPIREVIQGKQKLQYEPSHPSFSQLRRLFEI
ncbi:MAG: aminotransferase class IV [Cyanobacteria bacterium P01_A01_bin.84]